MASDDQEVVVLDDIDEASEGEASGEDVDDDDVGGGTDEEVPAPGENYFGRAAKAGAAPAGANPFAAPPPSVEDDWAAQIAEAKRQVEEQRIKREREEALEREREVAAAELRGKKYEGRRKADDPLPSEIAGGSNAATERRKFVKAKRSGGSSGTPAGGAGSPFAFGGGGDTPTGGGGSGGGAGGAAASPFAGFSLLAAPPANASGVGGGTNVSSDDAQPKPASILSRLSGGAFTGSATSGAGDANVEDSPSTAVTDVATNAVAPPGLFGSVGAASVTAAAGAVFGAAAATPTPSFLAPPPVSPCTGYDGDDKSPSAAAAASSPHVVDDGVGGGDKVRTALAVELGL